MVTMQGERSYVKESFFQLSVQLSAKGRRIVKGHLVERSSDMYDSRWYVNEEEEADLRTPQYRKAKRNTGKLWFKITIPYGKRYDKSWLLSSIEEECGFHFQAIQFHYINNMAVFFVDSFATAKSLMRASKKIQGEHYYKIVINATPSELPHSHPRPLHYVDMRSVTISDTGRCLNSSATHIEMCLQKRYKNELESLDLSDLSKDPDLRAANIFLPLNKESSVQIILQILAERFPQLLSLDLSQNNLYRLTGFAPLFYATPHLQNLNLSHNKLCQVQDLELLQDLDLRELWLEGNPFQASVRNSSMYHRIIVHHFPAIQKLDGQFFKPNFFFEVETPKELPPVKGSFFVREEVKAFMVGYLHRFFTLYDSGDRQALLPLYHDHAVCSFSLPNLHVPKICLEQLKEYWNENRNLLKVKKAESRLQLIKYNRLQVVGFLCNLPKTEHLLPSFTLDVSLQTPSLVCFSVEGTFKEASLKQENLFRLFRRTFLIVPAPEGCAQILNDQVVVVSSYVRSQETPSLPQVAHVEAANGELTPSPAKTEVIAGFAERTGMKMDWAQKCLEDNNWDVAKAAKIFAAYKDKGAIPREAFTDPEDTFGMKV